MENPREDVKKVIEQLVCRPTLHRQAEALQTYFTPDVQFYHFYLNIGGGTRDLTAIYQMGELLVNYQSLHFHDIVFDASANALAVQMTVFVRPWPLLFRPAKLVFFILLELQDYIRPEDGKKVKLIKVQRDYFDHSPALSLIPFFGWVYQSIWLRVILGHLLVLVARFLKFVARVFYPHYAQGKLYAIGPYVSVWWLGWLIVFYH